MVRNTGTILGRGSANEGKCYYVMSSLIDRANIQNDPCNRGLLTVGFTPTLLAHHFNEFVRLEFTHVNQSDASSTF